MQQAGGYADGLQQVVQDGVQPAVAGFILGQGPGHGLVDILVGPAQQGKDLVHGVGHTQLVHLGFHPGRGVHAQVDELLVKVAGNVVGGQYAAAVFVTHGDGAVDQVAQNVGQVAVDALHQQLIGHGAVAGKGDLVEQVVPHGVHAEQLHQVIGVDDVALGLGHLAVAHQQPGVAKHLLGQGLVQSHQQDGPVDGVEPQDVLANEVDIGGPVFLVHLAVVAVHVEAGESDIVAQGVDPHIGDVLGVKLHRDAPGEAGAGHAQVLQAGLQEVVDHLVLPGLGLDELGMLFDVLHQPGSVFAHAEEIGLLPGGLAGAAAVGTLAVHQLALGPEGFAGGAIHPLVLALVNVPLVIKLFEDLLHLLFVHGVGGADKAVIGGVHNIPDAFDFAGHVVHILLGGDAGGFGLFLDLLAVLVGAGLKIHVVAAQALEAADGVGQDDLIGVSDVRLAGGIGDGRTQIEFSLIHISFTSES